MRKRFGTPGEFNNMSCEEAIWAVNYLKDHPNPEDQNLLLKDGSPLPPERYALAKTHIAFCPSCQQKILEQIR